MLKSTYLPGLMHSPSPGVDSRVMGLRLEHGAGAPLHRQLESSLRGLLRAGAYRQGEHLPPEQALASALGISRQTVRQALSTLDGEGLLRRRRGFGTQVMAETPMPRIERPLSSFYAFAWELQARGGVHRSRVLARAALGARGAVAERLRLSPGDPVERIVRLRSSENEPLVLETAYLPGELACVLTTESLETEAIYDVLERLPGLVITGAREVILPVVLDRPSARLLGVRTGSPAFSVERLTWAEARPVEWQQSLVRGDRYLYSVDLPRRRGEPVPPGAPAEQRGTAA